MAPTTLRNVRVDDNLWNAAQTRAETENTTAYPSGWTGDGTD